MSLTGQLKSTSYDQPPIAVELGPPPAFDTVHGFPAVGADAAQAEVAIADRGEAPRSATHSACGHHRQARLRSEIETPFASRCRIDRATRASSIARSAGRRVVDLLVAARRVELVGEDRAHLAVLVSLARERPGHDDLAVDAVAWREVERQGHGEGALLRHCCGAGLGVAERASLAADRSDTDDEAADPFAVRRDLEADRGARAGRGEGAAVGGPVERMRGEGDAGERDRGGGRCDRREYEPALHAAHALLARRPARRSRARPAAAARAIRRGGLPIVARVRSITARVTSRGRSVKSRVGDRSSGSAGARRGLHTIDR